MKRALILGIGGQDGSYLAEILLDRGYEVHGMYRRSSTGNLRNVSHLLNRITLHRGDMADAMSIHRIVRDVRPQEIYNEADQDDVGWASSIPSYSMDITAGAVCRLLDSVLAIDPSIRVFQPVSAMMFGNAPWPQNESTPFNPLSVYGCAKAAAYYLSRMYCQVHGMFVSTAILYNHDSPSRSEDYVLHKICKSAVRIARGKQKLLILGNLDQRIDIGYARDYMEAAYQIMQLDEPDDFVIGTGTAWTIGQMVQEAFTCAGVSGSLDEHVAIDESFQKPGPRPILIADAGKAKDYFGFDPATTIDELIRMLVEHDIKQEAWC